MVLSIVEVKVVPLFIVTVVPVALFKVISIPATGDLADDAVTADKLADEDLTPDIIDSALISYSNDKAKTTFLFRAIAQFVAPTGFTPRYYAKDVNGKMWGTQLLAKEYQNMVQEHNNDQPENQHSSEGFI